jgi:proline iminopeptidase
VPDFADPERGETLARWDADRSLQINFACNRALGEESKRGSEQERDACGRVSLPVLVVHGSEDPRPLDGVRALVEALPNAQPEAVPGAGHLPWTEQPQLFARLVRDFLAGGGA